ncbi:MAG: S-layer homology domain-containing protein, partial [Bacillota bacterium]|nr:S-layer homology domain-containing protein [Bacillota bacterium]
MKRKGLALILALVIVFASFPLNLSAEGQTASGQDSNFKDMNNHWAVNVVKRWVEKGFISGYDDKTFKPDRNITRAEFALLINKVFGYQVKAKEEFSDVKSTDWFHDAVSKVRNAGVITGYNNSFSPNSPITRQDAAVIAAKAFELAGTDNSKVKGFKDSVDVKEYAYNYISALALKGYLKGFEDNTIRPLKNLTRAETVALLDNITGEILNKKGQYTPKTLKGNLVINTGDVTLKDTSVKGDLYLTEGIGEGNVTFDNVTVEGNTYIKGGGTHSVVFKNSRLASVFVQKKNSPVRVALEGNTTAVSVNLTNKAKIEVSEGTKISIVKIEKSAEGTDISGKGTLESIEVKAKDVLINNKKAEENVIYKVEAGDVEVKPSPTS